MVEVVVAAMLLALASIAVLGMVITTARNTFRSEGSQVVSNRLQEEMEKIKHLPYSQIALAQLPADSSDTGNPAWRVVGTSYATTQSGGQVRPLVYNGSALVNGSSVTGGAIDPTPTHFQSGDIGGTIYRYVVWEDDPNCSETACPGAQDLKRIIVAIVLDSTPSGGVRHYQELQSQVADPSATPATGTSSGGGNGGTAKPWTLWLSDTTCDQSSRQEIMGDHPTHNTRGTCDAGLRTGNDAGAPDLMFAGAPPFEAEKPIFDYSSEIEPTLDPDQDKGVQLLVNGTSGCPSWALGAVSGAESDAGRFQIVHKWLSKPIPDGYDVQLDGTGTVDLWTRSINGVTYPGTICVWLFVRSSGQTTDTAAVNTAVQGGPSYFTLSKNPWPTSWTELHVPLSFTLSTHLLPGSRLGLAVGAVAGTFGDGLAFMYDEPSFDSRLELMTHSTLPS
jgi:hypothetical protein